MEPSRSGFLEMEGDGKISLVRPKLVLGVALDRTAWSAVRLTAPKSQPRQFGCQSLAELIQVCRKTWEWR